MIVEKKVVEYSNRKRIDINKSDGFKAGEEVIILSKDDYLLLKNSLLEYQVKLTGYEKQLSVYNDIDNIINKTVKKTLKNIKLVVE